jgi:hypothetical protein
MQWHFGGLAVEVSCSDTAVAHTLHHHFQHCQNPASSPLTHYHIQQTAHDWRLFVGQTPLLAASHPLALFEPLLQNALQCLIEPQQQLMVFHAGGIAWAGQGVLLCGLTGSGKSTLVAQLITAGFDYLTDEVVAIPVEEFMLSGFARPLVLKPGSRFLWQNAPPNDDLLALPDGITWIAPTFFRQARVPRTAVPKFLLFPHFEAGSSFAARPFTTAESAFHLLQHLVNARNLPEHGLPVVTKLAQTVPAYEVRFSDGLAVAAWIRQQLGV